MDTTRSQGTTVRRTRRSLYLIAIPVAIVLSIGLVDTATDRPSSGPSHASTTVGRFAVAPKDPAAQIHLRIATELARTKRHPAA